MAFVTCYIAAGSFEEVLHRDGPSPKTEARLEGPHLLKCRCGCCEVGDPGSQAGGCWFDEATEPSLSCQVSAFGQGLSRPTC